jgi:hypothetical protein
MKAKSQKQVVHTTVAELVAVVSGLTLKICKDRSKAYRLASMIVGRLLTKAALSGKRRRLLAHRVALTSPAGLILGATEIPDSWKRL